MPDEYLAELTSAIAGADTASALLKTALLSNSTNPAPVFDNATTALAGGAFNEHTDAFIAVGNPLGWARREIVRVPLVATNISEATSIDVVDLRNKNLRVPAQKVRVCTRRRPSVRNLPFINRLLILLVMQLGSTGLRTFHHWDQLHTPSFRL